MKSDWIIGVLDDLRSFALANGLPRLAGRLEEAAAVAEEEVHQGAPPHPQGTGPPLPAVGRR